MSDSNTQEDRVVGRATLLDFPDPEEFSGRRILIGVAVGLPVAGFLIAILWWAGSGTSTSGQGSRVLVVLLILALPVLLYVRYSSAHWRLDDLLAVHAGASIQDIFSLLLAPRSFRLGTNWARVARTLAGQGRVGTVVRIAKPNRAAFIDQIMVPFEPMPLDESVPQFVGLEEHAQTVELESGATQTAHAPPDQGLSRRSLRRRILLSGGWLMIAIFAFNAAMGGWESYRRGHITFNTVMWTVYFIMAFVGLGGRGAWRSRQQWLLVPGGLASRRARFRCRDWELHLFRRESSVLIVKNQSRYLWTAYVADQGAHQMARMTGREAVMLLRAWLSPLPTPPLERLSDLA